MLRELLHRLLAYAPWRRLDAVRQLQLSIVLLCLLVGGGTLGFRLIEGLSWLDALYMTVTTLTTVGFGEVKPFTASGRTFTIGLIILGLATSAYAIRNAIELTLGDTLLRSLGEREMKRNLEAIHDHFIICGFGRMGQEIAREFQRAGYRYVVVDVNELNLARLMIDRIPYIHGNATEDDVLVRAGIERAKGLLAVLDNDAANILLTLSARGLNSKITIVARAATVEMESKLRRAGADIVTSPYVIGGQRMAIAMTRPAVHDFLNKVVHSEEEHSEMGQLTIAPRSRFLGQAMRDCDFRQQWEAIVVAIIDRQGHVSISPHPDYVMQVGDTLILVAPTDKLKALEATGITNSE